MMRPDAKVEKDYLYPKPVDFRKSIDGLAALVELDIKVAVFDPVLFGLHYYRSPRGLDKELVLQLSIGQGLRDGLNPIIGGPTGVGKPGWPAPWPTRPAEMATGCVTFACRACWKDWVWPMATGVSPC